MCNFKFSLLIGNALRSIEDSKRKSLTDQALLLTKPEDRLVAVQRVVGTMQVLIARSVVVRALALLCRSRSPNGLASDLESIGLGDIRTLVKLMCLVAPHSKAKMTPLSSSLSPSKRDDTDVSESDELANLSLAIGALAQNDSTSSQLLVQLCTQVRDVINLTKYSYVV